MNWYKVHNGLPFDTKLAVIAKRTGLRRGEILALWVTLLDQASRNKPRGSVQNLCGEEMALLLEFDAAAVDAALQAFRDKRMISAEGLLTDWRASQVLSATQRARDCRERKKLKNSAAVPAPESKNADSEEEASRRRQRLQEEISDRHKKRRTPHDRH